VILDDRVLDMSKFPLYHPGGNFVLTHDIGRDISKFFYGGYILENYNRSKPHTHTNIARIVVNRLSIAYMNGPANIYTVRVAKKEAINSFTATFTLQTT
jgi:hypothetical protein